MSLKPQMLMKALALGVLSFTASMPTIVGAQGEPLTESQADYITRKIAENNARPEKGVRTLCSGIALITAEPASAVAGRYQIGLDILRATENCKTGPVTMELDTLHDLGLLPEGAGKCISLTFSEPAGQMAVIQRPTEIECPTAGANEEQIDQSYTAPQSDGGVKQ